jgi:hypothetical protein
MSDSVDGEVDYKESYFKVLEENEVIGNAANNLLEENNGLRMALEAEIKSGEEFAALLDLLMVVDPWPEQVNRDAIKGMADSEAARLGYKDWLDAYHNFER